MHKSKFILSIFFWLLATQSTAQTFSKVKGQWVYADKYTFNYLSICDDNTFLWYTSSCTYSYHIAGTLKIDHDTLILVGVAISNYNPQPRHAVPVRTLKFLLNKNRIYTYSESPTEYMAFQSLSKTDAKDLSEAIRIRRERLLPAKRVKRS